ncbi:MAG: hypothetical protein WCJ30_11305 [Deltaproteobacteria bacterium]
MTDSRDDLRAALGAFVEAGEIPAGPERLCARRAAALLIHAAVKSGPVAPVVRTLPLVHGPVPRKAALGEAVRTHAPFVLVRHRALLVQCFHRGAVRTVLWNPTDVRHALEIPAFDRMRRGAGRLAAGLLTRVEPHVTLQLAALGLREDRVDVLGYDQLDAQYPSAMLARFPRPRMAVSTLERERFEHPRPHDAVFTVNGPGIDRSRVQFVDDHWQVGDGVLLLRTGGRRPGHVALVVHSARGVLVASGNALSLDGYVPASSRLPGLAAFAAEKRLIHVGAYPGVGRDPVEAMAVEYAIADRHPTAPVYPFVLPTVELVASVAAPRVKPGVMAPDLALGTLARA